MDGTRKIVILLLLAAAVPAAAETYRLQTTTAAGICLPIGGATYRIANGTARADYTVRIDPNAAAADVRVNLAATPDDADFVFVDDGEVPACHPGRTAPLRTVMVSTTATKADLVIGLAPAATADYRVYVRSARLSPEAAASLYAVARMPTGSIAGR